VIFGANPEPIPFAQNGGIGGGMASTAYRSFARNFAIL